MKKKTDMAGLAGDTSAARICLALGAGAALAGLAGLFFCTRRIARGPRDVGIAAQASPDGPATLDCAELIDNALMARLAIKARFAQEAHAIDHDLRGPVGAMAVALELLRTADDDATRDEVAEVLQRQVARMTTLTQRVHDLAQQLAD